MGKVKLSRAGYGHRDSGMTKTEGIVFIVDDDASVRRSLERLLRSLGFAVETFASALAFLSRDPGVGPACLVLDVWMPGLNGLALQDELAARQRSIPIIFISGHGTIPMCVRAMKGGAVDFLTKPFDDQDLVAAIGKAIDQDRKAQQKQTELAEIQRRIDSLTPREREVLQLVVAGKLNKQIAFALGTSEKTIKVHRAHVMEKTQANSLAELVRLTDRHSAVKGLK